VLFAMAKNGTDCTISTMLVLGKMNKVAGVKNDGSIRDLFMKSDCIHLFKPL
jgi:hypothetical protein